MGLEPLTIGSMRKNLTIEPDDDDDDDDGGDNDDNKISLPGEGKT